MTKTRKTVSQRREQPPKTRKNMRNTMKHAKIIENHEKTMKHGNPRREQPPKTRKNPRNNQGKMKE